MSRLKFTAGMLGLLALLLLDVGLVYLAKQGVQETSLGSESRITQASATTPTVDTTATTAATTASQAAAATPLKFTLAALDDTTAWRARVGTCKAGGATLEQTTDGGATWTKVTFDALAAVTRIQPTTATALFLVGAAQDCKAVIVSSADAGQTWGQPSSVGDAWGRDPQRPDTVLAPGSTTSQPCSDAVVDLARATTQKAFVLCTDGTVRATADGAANWTDLAPAEGLLAISTRTGDRVIGVRAATAADKCTGSLVVLGVASDRVAKLGCAPAAGSSAAGTVALSFAGTTGWLVSGAHTWVSTDNLKTWVKKS